MGDCKPCVGGGGEGDYGFQGPERPGNRRHGDRASREGVAEGELGPPEAERGRAQVNGWAAEVITNTACRSRTLEIRRSHSTVWHSGAYFSSFVYKVNCTILK